MHLHLSYSGQHTAVSHLFWTTYCTVVKHLLWTTYSCQTLVLDNIQLSNTCSGQHTAVKHLFWTTYSCQTLVLDNIQLSNTCSGQHTAVKHLFWTTYSFHGHLFETAISALHPNSDGQHIPVAVILLFRTAHSCESSIQDRMQLPACYTGKHTVQLSTCVTPGKILYSCYTLISENISILCLLNCTGLILHISSTIRYTRT
jgi:hypothetical protein